jgi:hypothetical protein
VGSREVNPGMVSRAKKNLLSGTSEKRSLAESSRREDASAVCEVDKELHSAVESDGDGEGPTLDNQANLYFSPLNPLENVSLVWCGTRIWRPARLEQFGRSAASGSSVRARNFHACPCGRLTICNIAI